MRQFSVTPVLNGFIVAIGCQTVVFESNSALLDAIRDYLHDPEGTERSFLDSALHPLKTYAGVAPPIPPTRGVCD